MDKSSKGGNNQTTTFHTGTPAISASRHSNDIVHVEAGPSGG